MFENQSQLFYIRIQCIFLLTKHYSVVLQSSPLDIISSISPTMKQVAQFGRKILAIRRGVSFPPETLTPFLVRILARVGIWMDSDQYGSAGVRKKCLLFANHVNFGIFILTMIMDLVAPKESMSQLVNSFCQVFAITSAYLKAEIVQWQRKSLTNIFAKVAENDKKLRLKSAEDQEIEVLRGHFYWKELSLVMLFVFFDGCAVVMALGYIFLSPSKQLPFPASFPFSTEDGSWGFWVAYVSQCWGTILLSINYLLMDASIGSCYNQISLRFQVFGREIEKVQETADSLKRKQKLQEIVVEHEQLYRWIIFCRKI